MPRIGVFVGFLGIGAGLAMAFHGINARNYASEWGVAEGVVLIVMSLMVYVVSRK